MKSVTDSLLVETGNEVSIGGEQQLWNAGWKTKGFAQLTATPLPHISQRWNRCQLHSHVKVLIWQKNVYVALVGWMCDSTRHKPTVFFLLSKVKWGQAWSSSRVTLYLVTGFKIRHNNTGPCGFRLQALQKGVIMQTNCPLQPYVLAGQNPVSSYCLMQVLRFALLFILSSYSSTILEQIETTSRSRSAERLLVWVSQPICL